jgi:hypothetical protein
MKTMSDRYSAADEESLAWNLLRGAIGFLWFVVRVPVGIVLAFLEPFVRLALFAIAVAGVITAFVYEGSSVVPPIPFWVTIGVSFGCILLLALYHGLLRLLSR